MMIDPSARLPFKHMIGEEARSLINRMCVSSVPPLTQNAHTDYS